MLGRPPDACDSSEWRCDTSGRAPGTVHLAVTPVADVQCYRYGRAGYGMQFQFEASRAVARDWARLFPDLSERMFPGWLAALPEREKTQGVAADAHGVLIARAWVGLI